MKGTLKGIGGAVVKPISVGLDFFMKTSEGVSNMVKIGGKKKALTDEDELMEAEDECSIDLATGEV